MLKPRIIPVLLVRDGGLVKTVRFGSPKYVGDPINAVKIFNEKEVDELVVLDIDATAKKREPDYNMIGNLAYECRMPLCYGGGIRTVEQAEKILRLGVEKVALSSSAIENPKLVYDLSTRVGCQSVVLVLDLKQSVLGGEYGCYTHNGTRDTELCPFKFAKKAEQLGIGEVIINSIDHDGVMQGYDLELASRFKSQVSVPVTVLGGAGEYAHLQELIFQEGIVGAAAGSLFVFKGKYRAVLIHYPNREQKAQILAPFVESARLSGSVGQ